MRWHNWICYDDCCVASRIIVFGNFHVCHLFCTLSILRLICVFQNLWCFSWSWGYTYNEYIHPVFIFPRRHVTRRNKTHRKYFYLYLVEQEVYAQSVLPQFSLTLLLLEKEGQTHLQNIQIFILAKMSHVEICVHILAVKRNTLA